MIGALVAALAVAVAGSVGFVVLESSGALARYPFSWF